MAEKIDLSLDEIIKANKTSKTSGGPRGRGRGGRGGRGGGGGVPGRSRSRSRGPVKVQQGQTRSRSRSRGGGRGGRRLVSAGAGGRRSGLASPGPGKLIISNLDFGVSESDIQELFGEFGNLKSASLHYDKQGKSLGTADVIYSRGSDAVKAMKQYDGVPLDGRIMKIELAASSLTVNSAIPGTGPRSASGPRRRSRSIPRFQGGKISKSGARSVQRYKGFAQKKGTSRGAKKNVPVKKGAIKKSPVSREALDMEIDNFMQTR